MSNPKPEYPNLKSRSMTRSNTKFRLAYPKNVNLICLLRTKTWSQMNLEKNQVETT